MQIDGYAYYNPTPKYLDIHIQFDDCNEFMRQEYMFNLFMMKSVFFRVNILSFDGSNMNCIFISHLIKVFNKLNHNGILGLKRILLNNNKNITNKNAINLITLITNKDNNLFNNLEYISFVNTSITDKFARFYMDKYLHNKNTSTCNRNINAIQLNLSRNNISLSVLTQYSIYSNNNEPNMYFYSKIYYENNKKKTNKINKKLNDSRKRGKRKRGYGKNSLHSIIASGNYDEESELYDESRFDVNRYWY